MVFGIKWFDKPAPPPPPRCEHPQWVFSDALGGQMWCPQCHRHFWSPRLMNELLEEHRALMARIVRCEHYRSS